MIDTAYLSMKVPTCILCPMAQTKFSDARMNINICNAK